MRLSQFMNYFEGQLISDGEFETLEYCTSSCPKRYITFLDRPEYIDKLGPMVRCIFTTEKLMPYIPEHIQGVVLCKEPKKNFVLLHNVLVNNAEAAYSRPAFKTSIGKNCKISPLAYVADRNVMLGDNVEIAAFSVINKNVTLGNNCVIHEHCVVGGKSFNFVRTKNNEMIGMTDAGQVILGDNVEVCAHCHIANGPLPTDETRLEESVKLDAFVHIGHGTKVGRRTLIPAGAQIAGNVVIGEDAWIGVNATIANRITIQNQGRVSLGSVVTKDVGENETVTGNFAIPHEKFINNLKNSSGGGVNSLHRNRKIIYLNYPSHAEMWSAKRKEA